MEVTRTHLYSSHRSNIWKEERPGLVQVVKQFCDPGGQSSQEIHYHKNLAKIPGVVAFIGGDYDASSFLVMEYCVCSLKKYITTREAAIPENLLLSWYQSMAGTLRQVHEQRVVHRFIRADKWLVTEDEQVKLTHFGLAKLMSAGESAAPVSDPANPGWSSTKIFAEDAFHLAQVFYQMATFDFQTRVLPAPRRVDFSGACARRGYTESVARCIHLLLELGNQSHQDDIGLTLKQIEEQINKNELSTRLEELIFTCFKCLVNDGCYSCSLCERRYCEDCKCSVPGANGEFLCEMCELTVRDASPQMQEWRGRDAE